MQVNYAKDLLPDQHSHRSSFDPSCSRRHLHRAHHHQVRTGVWGKNGTSTKRSSLS